MSKLKNKLLPLSWSSAQLSEISLLIRGVSYKKEHVRNSAEPGYKPLLRATNITGSSLTFDALVYVPDSYISEAQVLKQGDVVIASSSGSKEVVGKAGQLHFNSWTGSFGAFCTALRPSTYLDSKYFGYYFQSPDYREAISDISAGSNINNIKSSDLAIHIIPIAPRNEQSRIVEKLEELFSDLDAGVTELKAAQKKLAQYRQSLLKSAVEGTLTAEWRTKNKPIETGAQLLERILKERRARWEEKQLTRFKELGKTPPKGWQDKYPEPVQPDTANLPDLPEGWIWASIEQCSLDEAAITDGPFGSNLKSEHYQVHGPRVIRLQNIGDGVFIDAKAHISEEHFASLTKHSVTSGDLIVAMLGEVLPRACVVPEGVEPAIVKADCARVRVNKVLVSPEVINAYLNAPPIRERVAGSVKGIGRPRINLGHIRAIQIPLCSFSEQKAINTALNEANLAIDNQLAAIELGLKQADAERKNILKFAYSGQLVTQDPKDEPASKLLVQIYAERSEREIKPKERKTKKVPVMKKIDIKSLREWIEAYPKDQFTFDELRGAFPGNYEILKDSVFQLLSEKEAVVHQFFDEAGGIVRFKRVLP